MTPEMFQDALCEEIRNLLKDRVYKKPPPEPEEPQYGEESGELDDELMEESEEEPEEVPEEVPEEEPVEAPEPELVPMAVYPQSIPVPSSDDEEWDPVPYIIVRLNSGNDANTTDSEYIIEVVVIMGVWDDDRNAQGHRELLNIINVVYARFMRNPCLANQYVYRGGFEWEIQEDGYYPYYFGAFKMNFAIPAIRREDPYC